MSLGCNTYSGNVLVVVLLVITAIQNLAKLIQASPFN